MSLWSIAMWVVLGILLTIPLRRLAQRDSDSRHKIAALGLVVAALIYVVSGFMTDHLPRELGGMLIFAGLAIMAVGHMPQLVVLGWLGHTAWDVLGMLGYTGHALPGWYPPLCIGFDMAIAAILLGALHRDSMAAAPA